MHIAATLIASFALLSLQAAALSPQQPPATETAAPEGDDPIRAEVEDLIYRMNLSAQLGQPNPGAEFGERAVQVAVSRFGPEDLLTLRAMNDLANLYTQLGRYAETEALRVHVLEAMERSFGNDDQNTLVALMNLAALYFYQGRYGQAEPLFLRALEAQERTLGPDHSDTIVTVNNLAALYRAQDRNEEALIYAIRALEAADRTLGPHHPYSRGAATNLASLYHALGRYVEAEPLYQRTLEPGGELRLMNHPENLTAMTSLGDLYEDQARCEQAESHYAMALELSDITLGSDHPATLDRARRLASVRLRWTEAPEPALAPARFLAAGLRARRAAIPLHPLATAQDEREQADLASYFTIVADSAWAARDARPDDRSALENEAFTALQDAAAGTTSRAVVHMAVRRFADAAGARLGTLVRERETLEEEWSSNNQLYSEALAQTGPEAETLKARLRSEGTRLEARMLTIDANLRQSFPEYFSLIRPEALDIEAVQALLAPDEALLMVMPTEFGTHVIAVTHNEFSWARSGWTREQVDAAVNRLLTDIRTTLDTGGETYRFDRTIAHSLYQQIVTPVADVLGRKRHVFVAAAGSLSSLPFGILVTETPSGADTDSRALRNTHWFADSHALTQIPSIQSLAFLRRLGSSGARQTDQSEPPAFIGLGNPRLDGPADPRHQVLCARGGRPLALATGSVASLSRTRAGGMIADVAALRRLCPLPGTATELEQIRTALRAPLSSLLVAENFTEHRIRQTDLSAAGVIVFATHGLVAGEMQAPTEPGLVLTPPATATEDDDGYLGASEVATLRLDADWVILSACDTASGDGSVGAPGLSGLARAFFFAGARNLLVSHWKVVDAVGPRLTVRAIQLSRGGGGLSYAEALQQAMREVREDPTNEAWAHPAVWAPFALVGDGAR